MVRLLADENLNYAIIRGLLRREPTIDLVRVQDAGLKSASDPVVLEWAALNGRIVLTHDVSTMTFHAYQRIQAGLPMPGVFEIPRTLATGPAIEDVLLIVQCSLPNEWEGQVRYLPLR